MPRLPPVAPRPVSEPPPAPEPVAPLEPPPTEAVPKQRSRVPRRGFRRAFTAICTLIALGLFATGVYGAYLISVSATEVADEGGLVSFNVAPPLYGTVNVLVDQQGPDAETYTVTANGDASVRYFAYAADSVTNPGGLGVMDPNGLYFLSAQDTNWTLVARAPAELLVSQTFMAKVLTFADCVPDTARPYTEVVEQTEATIGGRVVQRYVLRTEVGRWSSNKPSAYAAWDLSGGYTPESSDVMEFTVFVDQNGLVWQLEIGESDELLTVTLQSFSPEVFATPMPSVYIDQTNGGVLVGG